MSLIDQLMRHEGLSLTPYRDTVGKLTIGYGHNLDDKPISKRAARVILEDDIADATAQLKLALPWTQELDTVRRNALVDMVFNMGIRGLLGFKNTLAALEARDYARAAEQVLASKYARQVGGRAQTVARQIRTGEE